MLVYDVSAFANIKFDKNCRANNKYQPAKAVYQCLIQFPFASVLLLLLFINIKNVHILKSNNFSSKPKPQKKLMRILLMPSLQL